MKLKKSEVWGLNFRKDLETDSEVFVRYFFYIIGLGFLILSSSACTRTTGEQTSVRFSVPQKVLANKVSGQNTADFFQLGYLVVNITGPGIARPINRVFERDHCETCDRPIPSTISLDVPAGDNRLIQVLAVYLNSADKSFEINYGDITTAIQGLTQTIPLRISPIAPARSVVSGQVSGRYWSPTGHLPTGEVRIMYKPQDKPALQIKRGFISKGWFSLFGLAGISLIYEVDDGSVLFGGVARDLKENYFEGNHQKIRVTVPLHQRQNGNEGSDDYRIEEPMIHVIGWFGPQAFSQNKYVCLKPPPPSSLFLRLRKYNSNDPNNQMNFSQEPAPTTISELFTSNNNALHFNGGVVQADSPCNSGLMEYNNKLTVDWSNFNGFGKDKASGMMVPYEKRGADFVSFPENSSGRGFDAKLLPGVEDHIKDIIIYKITGAAAYSFEFDSERPFNCASIPAGFAEVGRAGVPQTGAHVGQIFVPAVISSTDLAAGPNQGLALGVCFVERISGRIIPRGGFIGARKFTYQN